MRRGELRWTCAMKTSIVETAWTVATCSVYN